ncbi:MAG: hypothetical protein M1308_02045 [Actinobacteria bacterium]|nr:hypothetical protein [Actinomycetota bacterium]
MKNINRLHKISFILILFITTIIIVFSLILSAGCSNKSGVKADGTSVSDAQSGQSSTDSLQNSSGSESSSTTTQPSSTTTKLETTTSEQIPSDIQQMIDEADKYYNNGEYSEAVSAYRKIKPAVEGNDSISASLKEQIINSYSENFEDSKTITETARMHYGNAMQLEYEKRIDEAIKELEEALKIYPKYQDAIDKLDSIKSLYKLK